MATMTRRDVDELLLGRAESDSLRTETAPAPDEAGGEWEAQLVNLLRVRFD
jgi:hypothetical protein